MQFERAVSDFTRVIELDSGNANAYFNRGSAYVFCHFRPPGSFHRFSLLV
jgi:hypothetical protein